MCNRRDISIAPTTLSIRLYTQTTKEHQDSTDRRTDGRTMLFPTTLRVLARRGGGPRGRGSLMSSPFLEVYYLLIVIEPERMCFFFFSLSLRFPIRCVESNFPRVGALGGGRLRERKVSVSSFESLSLSLLCLGCDADLLFSSSSSK